MDHKAGRLPGIYMNDLNGNNASLHHVPTKGAVGGYNIDDDLLDALLDPMAPLDFGSIDLDQITGYPQEISTSEGDFGVVPIEPIRDGMVPQLQHLARTNNNAFSMPLPPTITTGSPRPAAFVLSTGDRNAFPDAPTYSPITTGVSIKEEETGNLEDVPFHSLRGAPRREKQHQPKVKEIKTFPLYHKTGLKTTGRAPIFEDSRKREDILARWREKKARRNYNRPKVQYESRKRTALEKCRVNGKFVKPEIYRAYVEAQEKSAKQALHTVPTVPTTGT